MRLTYSQHWKNKKKYRSDITNDLIELAITNSNEIKDKKWKNAINAILRIPPSGRIIKVVYRKIGKGIYKIITAYWLD